MKIEVTKIPNLLTNGFIKTINSDGTLDVDINSYALSSSIGNGILTLNTGTYLSGSTTFSANQTGNTTFNVTTNATSANTASTIVARDSNGNFLAGAISATTFTGSLIGTASNVSNALTFNTSGGASGGTTYNGSVARTIDYSTIGASPLSGSTYYIPYSGATGNINLGSNNLTVDTNTIFVDSVNHRVGIGTVTPTATLHSTGILSANSGYENSVYINPTISQTGTAGYNALYINATHNSVGTGVRSLINCSVNNSGVFAIGFDGYIETTGGLKNNSSISYAQFSLATSGPAISRNRADAVDALVVSNSNSGSTGNILTLKNSLGAKVIVSQAGKVGIGTVVPASALDVYGTISISGATVFTTPLLSGSTGTARQKLVGTSATTAPTWANETSQLTVSAITTTNLDFNTDTNFYILMDKNIIFTVSNLATNIGKNGMIILDQNGTGGWSFTIATEMKTPLGGATIIQVTTAGTTSGISYYVLSATKILINYIGNFA